MFQISKKHKVILTDPDTEKPNLVGNERSKEQLIAAWTLLPGDQKAMTPTIIGPGGSGKTALAANCALTFSDYYYTFQCNKYVLDDDLLFLGSPKKDGPFFGSALLSAILTGAPCIMENSEMLDEAAWFTLLSLLDNRNYIVSQTFGKRFTPKTGFRLVFLFTSEDGSIPVQEQILSRLTPIIEIQPKLEDYGEIIRRNTSAKGDTSDDEIIEKTVHYVSKSPGFVSVLDAINIFSFCKRLAISKGVTIDVAFEQTIELMPLNHE